MLSAGIRAVFFDAVGTLIYPDPPAPVVYAEVGKRHGSRLGIEEITARFRSAFGRQEEADRRHGWRTSEQREVERWRQIVGEVLDDVRDPEACFRELYEHFGRPDGWRLDADAAVLGAVAARGFVCGIASNYDHRLGTVAAGLPELASARHVVISAAVGWRKPAAGFYAAVCAAAALPPQQTLYVGDDRGNDYDGARAAGLAALLYDPRGREAVPAGERVGSLREVLELLAPLAGAGGSCPDCVC
jgi:putative hydrolase of the HAD superfamily